MLNNHFQLRTVVNPSATSETLKIRGYLYEKQDIDLFSLLYKDEEELSAAIKGLKGHFSFTLENAEKLLLVVDKTRAVPLFLYEENLRPIFHPSKELNPVQDNFEYNKEQIKLFAMSGFTHGPETLVKGLTPLLAGEYILIDKVNKKLKKDFYFQFLPNKSKSPSKTKSEYQKELANLTLDIFKDLIKFANGREIVVPLSAGLDSRLVISALKHLGYENLKSFSYGLEGNSEALFAKEIAQKLNVPWRFFPQTVRSQKHFFNSTFFKEYRKFCTDYCTVPFFQDIKIIHDIQNEQWVSKDAIFVNGNSGDYISGNHLLLENTNDELLEKYINKHLSLWNSLKTTENKNWLKIKIHKLLKNIPLKSPETDLNIQLENLELLDRQSKYVVSGQRSYEYCNYDWSLPLWHDDYLDFFKDLPTEFKQNQSLYKEMLMQENWGEVWQNIPVNKMSVVPKWIRPLRFAGKILNAPLGKEAWHRFEKKYFLYWMEVTCGNAIVPYTQVALDPHGHRHFVSWHTRLFLEEIGFSMEDIHEVSLT